MSCVPHRPNSSEAAPYWICRTPAGRGSEGIYTLARRDRPLPPLPQCSNETHDSKTELTSVMLWDEEDDDDDDDETLHRSKQAEAHIASCSRVRTELSSIFAPVFDAACLDALDDELLASPRDCFADLCYATSTGDADLRRRGPGYAAVSSWQCALSPASPSSRLPRLDGAGDSESDSDDEPDLRTPIQSCIVRDQWCNAGADMPAAPDTDDARHVRFAQLPSLAQSSVLRIQAPVPVRTGRCAADVDAEVAFLFSSSPPPDPSHAIHFFPTRRETDARRPGRLMKASAHLGSRIRHVAGLQR